MRRVALILTMSILCNSPAFGQNWFVAPVVGRTFQTATGFVDLEGAAKQSKTALGVSVGRMTDRWIGFEGEIGVLPGLFNGDTGLVSSSRVVTLMGNAVLSPKAFLRDGLVRPYAVVGAGGMFVRLRDVADVFSTSVTLQALNAGGGAIVRLRPRLALRGDLRYFRSGFEDPRPGAPGLGSQYLHFWRANTGVMIRF